MRRTGIYALSAGVWVSSHLHVGAYEYIDASVVACAWNSRILHITFLRLNICYTYTVHVHFVLDITRLVVVVVDLDLACFFIAFSVLCACEERAVEKSKNNKSMRGVRNVKMRGKSTTTSTCCRDIGELLERQRKKSNNRKKKRLSRTLFKRFAFITRRTTASTQHLWPDLLFIIIIILFSGFVFVLFQIFIFAFATDY